MSQDKHILTLFQEGASVASYTNFRDEAHEALPSYESTHPDTPHTPTRPEWRNCAWKAACLRFFRSEKGRELLAKYKLAERTALIGVAVIASFADRETGRNMFASYDTIGKLMTIRLHKAGAKTGAGQKTVANLFAILRHEDLKLVHRDKAAHGSEGTGQPNVYTLLIPESIPARITAYPKVGTTFSSSRNVSPLVTKSAARAREPKPSKTKKTSPPLPPPTIAQWKFANELTRRDLVYSVAYPDQTARDQGRGSRTPRHLAGLARAVGAVVNPELWTAEHWARACDLEARAHGWTSLSHRDVRDPVRLLRKRAARFAAIHGVDLHGDPVASLRALKAWSDAKRAALKARVDQAQRTRKANAAPPLPEAPQRGTDHTPARDLLTAQDEHCPPGSEASDEAILAEFRQHPKSMKYMPTRLRNRLTAAETPTERQAS